MFRANSIEEDASAENARAKVRKYCKQEKQSQASFGRMLDITETTFSRFMRGATSMGSYAYPAVINFFEERGEEDSISSGISSPKDDDDDYDEDDPTATNQAKPDD